MLSFGEAYSENQLANRIEDCELQFWLSKQNGEV